MRIDLGVTMQRRFERLASSYATKPHALARAIVESWTLDAGHGHPALRSGVTTAAREKRMARADAKTARRTRKMLARIRKEDREQTGS